MIMVSKLLFGHFQKIYKVNFISRYITDQQEKEKKEGK